MKNVNEHPLRKVVDTEMRDAYFVHRLDCGHGIPFSPREFRDGKEPKKRRCPICKKGGEDGM